MKPKNTPTNNICAEKIFNSFVWFKDEKIYLSKKVPTIVALFLLLIMPPEIKIIYAMKDTTCSCGGKLHKHETKEWKMNKSTLYSNKDTNAIPVEKPILPH